MNLDMKPEASPDGPAHLGQADGPPERGRRLLERTGRALAGLAETGVDVDGHLLLLGHFPEGVVLGRELGVSRGEGRDDDALVAGGLGVAQPLDRGLDVDAGHLGQADEALGGGGHELVVHPGVVGLQAGQVVVVVVLGHEGPHGALGGEEDLGVDAVEVLLLDPGLALEGTPEDGVVGGAEPLEVLVALAVLAGVGDEAEGHGRGAGDELPGVAALLVLHQLGGPVVELLGQVLGPHVGRLDHVAVGRDEPVLTSHGSSLPPP